MKIVYCIPSCYNSGGMERVLSLKANYLADVLHYDVCIITTGQRNKLPYWPLSKHIQLIDLSINYDELESANIIKKTVCGLFKRYIHKKRLRKTLLHLKADVAISMFTHELPFLCTIDDGSYKVLELHFSRKFRMLHERYNKTGLLKKAINRYLNYRDEKAVRKYNEFVVLTNEDRMDWKDFADVKVISNPLSFIPAAYNENREQVAVAVGRLCPQKGFDMLVDIWGLIDCQLRRLWKLHIYGSGPDKDKLLSLIEAKGLNDEIKICEPTKDILSVYNNASLFCFSSRYEGLSMALIEAMVSGLACVSFDCPCGPKDVICDSENGFLVESFDCKTFANCVEELMRDSELRSRFGKQASMSVKSKLSLDMVMKQWDDLFNGLGK